MQVNQSHRGITQWTSTNIISHKPFKYKISVHILQSPQNPFPPILHPVGVQLGPERLSVSLQKYKKTADFLRNQRLNMVAGTGLEPAASGLWVIASILQSSNVQYNVYVSISYMLYIVRAVVCRILYLHHKEQIKNNVCTATISFPPGNRQLDSATQNSYTKISKRALSTDG